MRNRLYFAKPLKLQGLELKILVLPQFCYKMRTERNTNQTPRQSNSTTSNLSIEFDSSSQIFIDLIESHGISSQSNMTLTTRKFDANNNTISNIIKFDHNCSTIYPKTRFQLQQQTSYQSKFVSIHEFDSKLAAFDCQDYH